MCRLAYIPFNAEKEDAELVETLFEFLEFSFGGHGNGIGYFQDKKPRYYKGSNLTTNELTEHIVENSISAIFHTRLASMGSICDKNCHPFLYNGVLTAHNGHWSNATEMAELLVSSNKFSTSGLKNMSDSEVIACLIGNYGFSSTAVVDAGVILSLYKDHAKVFVEGDFEVIKTPQGRYYYASEFPKCIIHAWKIKEYFRFERGSIAKLTVDGPQLIKGNLSKTIPTSQPISYGQISMEDWNSFGYDFNSPTTNIQATTKKLSFLPKRRGKKAKRKPYFAHEFMKEVTKHIGYDETPELDILTDTKEYDEMQLALSELNEELQQILKGKNSRRERKWIAEECNAVILAWFRVNHFLIIQYEDAKADLEKSFGFSSAHGDTYLDEYTNLWVNFNDAWVLFSDLSDEEKKELTSGAAKWQALEDY